VQHTLDVWQRAVSERAPYETEYRMRRHDGEYRTLLARGVPVADKRGDVVEWVGTCIDITGRKQAERKAQRENREITLASRIFRVFLEESDDVLYDRALDIVMGGLASRHGVFGYIDEEGTLVCPTMSRMFDQCEMPDKCICYTRDKWKGLWSRALLEKRVIFTNESPRVPKGHVPIKNNLAAPILFGGEVIGLLNLANKSGDYTEEDRDLLEGLTVRIAPALYIWIQKKRNEDERSRAEQLLRQSREDLGRAQEVGNVGSWRLDVRKNELTWSDENHRMFGIPKGTLMTYETFLSTVHPADREYVDSSWEAGLAGEPYDIEHRIVVNGQIKWVREKAYLEFDEAGTLLGGFGITQDITERKGMEEELRKSRDELEMRVKQRTSELNQTVADLQREMEHRIAAEQTAQAERQRFNDVLETLPSYVCLLTPDYRVPFANHVFRESFGYEPDKKCYEFLFGRTEPCEDCQTFTVMRTNESHRWEWTGPNGRDYDIFDFPFTDTDGSRLILEMGIDVTERKRAERRLRTTNALLALFTRKADKQEYLDTVVKIIHR